MFIGATRCSIVTCKWLEYLLWSLRKRFIRLNHIKIFDTCKNCMTKLPQKKVQNTTINLSSYMFRVHSLILLASFLFVLLLNFRHLYKQRRANILFMFRFLETDIREQKSITREYRYLDNTVKDLRYEIKFENRGRDKNNF